MHDLKTIQSKLISAALQLAEQGQWQQANLSVIAKIAEIPLSEAFSVARSKSDLISFINEDLTQRILDEVGEISDDMSTRDALFDLLMTRFELMNAQRQAYLTLNKDISKDLGLATKYLGMSKTNMMHLAEITGIDTSGLSGTGKTLALTYLYLNVFNVWLKDETEDLSATMKKLDSELAKAENWALELKNFDFNSMFKSKPVTEPKAEHKPENS